MAVVVVFLAGRVGARRREQRERAGETNQFEVHSVFPREVSPGVYQQVSAGELQTLGSQGWKLVSVAPYVYRNE